MDRHPKALVLMLVGVGLLGASLFGWAWFRVESVAAALLYMTATAALDAWPSQVRDDVSISLGTVSIFTALLVGGVPLAILAAAGTGIATLIRRPPRVVAKFVFNTGQFATAAALGGIVFEWIAGSSAAFTAVQSGRGFAAVGAAGLVTTVVNYWFVALIVRLTTGDPIRSTMRGVMGSVLIIQYLCFGISVMAAVLIVEVHALALLLLIVPTLVARRGLQGFQAQREAYDNLVRSFVKVIEVKDPYTRGHAERVAALSEAVAGHLGHDYESRRMVRYAALLHDVGKVRVPLGIINKPCALDEHEAGVIREHPVTGAEILRDIEFLQPAIDIIRFHHERIDGRGYPYGVSGDQLSQHVRIVTAVDAFDAMTSTRSYRRALSVEQALDELELHVDSQFDAVVVAALREVVAALAWNPTTAFEPGIDGVVVPDEPGQTTPAILGRFRGGTGPIPLPDAREGYDFRRPVGPDGAPA